MDLSTGTTFPALPLARFGKSGRASSGRSRPAGAGRRALGGAAAAAVVVTAAAGLIGSLSHEGGRGDRGGAAHVGTALHGGVTGLGVDARAGASRLPSEVASKALAPRPVAGVTGVAAGAASGEKIEQTGTMTVLVPNARIQPDMSRLMALAEGFGGFVADTNTQSASPGNPAEGSVTLEVPLASFATAVADARALGKVASLSTQATDVTGQYVDLQAKITAAQDTRQQYLTIMSKATTIGGVLAVQAQLDDLQSRLQELQGQLKQLASETTYSTLTVTLSQKAVLPPPPRRVSGLLAAWRAAVGGFVAGFEAVVRVAGPLAFALLFLVTLYGAGRYLWRARRKRASSSVH